MLRNMTDEDAAMSGVLLRKSRAATSTESGDR
jgi:hypothetical protein